MARCSRELTSGRVMLDTLPSVIYSTR